MISLNSTITFLLFPFRWNLYCYTFNISCINNLECYKDISNELYKQTIFSVYITVQKKLYKKTRPKTSPILSYRKYSCKRRLQV